MLHNWTDYSEGDHAIITLKCGKTAIVDISDLAILAGYHWRIHPGGYACAYVSRDGKPRNVLMHRIILPTPKGMEVDHVNRNKLDNRRSNLRLATSSQNMANTGKRSHNTSGYHGVGWFPPTKRWRARINKDKREISLGYHHSILDAARAYDDAAIRLFGEFATLNFPDQDIG